MPLIVARKRGPCAACALLIEPGEQIDFTRKEGARHVACSELQPARRLNAHRAPCHACRLSLAAGEGALAMNEYEVEGVWRRRWILSCLDWRACAERVLSQQ